jgi:hypothetical protein
VRQLTFLNSLLSSSSLSLFCSCCLSPSARILSSHTLNCLWHTSEPANSHPEAAERDTPAAILVSLTSKRLNGNDHSYGWCLSKQINPTRVESVRGAGILLLGYHTGDGVRLLRQLLLSNDTEAYGPPSRADMDAETLCNEGVVGEFTVSLTSNVSDCSLGSKDQLTQSRKPRVIKQAREGLADPMLRDSRCLT